MHENLSTTKYTPCGQAIFPGIQYLIVAFGATVLVPLLTGLDPMTTLLGAGIGTLIAQIITQGKVPIFYGSSFAYIGTIIYFMNYYKELGDPLAINKIAFGMCAAGLTKIVVSRLIKIFGTDFIDRVVPPIVIGPVIMVIGLSLSPVAISMATGSAVKMPYTGSIIVSIITLLSAASFFIFGKGLFKYMGIVLAIFVGYLVSIPFGFVKFTAVSEAAIFSFPNMFWLTPNFDTPFIFMLIAVAPMVEHIGDIKAISGITGVNYVKDPGLNRTMLADGVATSISGLYGAPPNTSYSEVSGAVALTGIYNPFVMTIAAITAICLSMFGKFGAMLQTIPVPVMGGVMIATFGAIMVIGVKIIVEAQPDMNDSKNILIMGVPLVFALGGFSIKLNLFGTDLVLQKVALCAILGIILNLIFGGEQKQDKNEQTTLCD